MKKEEFIQLAEKISSGEATDADIALYNSWYNSFNIDAKWNENELGSLVTKETLLFNTIQANIDRSKRVKLWPRIAAAAAIIIVVGAGLFYFNQKPAVDQNQVAINDVSPGIQGATLTLANGKKIRLTDAANGELAKEAGVVITKSATGQLIYEVKDENSGSDKINVLTTDNGETYQVRLPDGSSVWLNAASTLKYPASFARLKDRRVELSGEGYFEVAKDKAHPFIVKTDKQEVEVLGTHFNVNAYADEKTIATTLLEGSVKVHIDRIAGKVLKPGQQALNKGNAIQVREVDTESIMDWKEGDFYFEQVDFRSVMRKIGRWYDVEVIYDKSVPENITSSGLISRNNNLSAVLKSIEKSGQVHFKIEGKTVYVTK